MRKFAGFALLGSLVFSSTPVLAADQFEEAIDYRQAAFTMIKWNFGNMGAMVKGAKPYDPAAFKEFANNLAFLAKQPWEGFIQGSDLGDTSAKAAVWDDPEGFKEKQKAFNDEVMKLVEAANSGDKDAIKAQFASTGKSCKACHKEYKMKD